MRIAGHPLIQLTAQNITIATAVITATMIGRLPSFEFLSLKYTILFFRNQKLIGHVIHKMLGSSIA